MKRHQEHDPTERVRIDLPFDEAIRRALTTRPEAPRKEGPRKARPRRPKARPSRPSKHR